MRTVGLVILIISRILAVGAVLAAIGAGFLQAWLGAVFVCFDSCPDTFSYFPTEGPKAIQIMTPCVAIELAALALFLLYCLITRQPLRAVKQAIALVALGIVGIVALNVILTAGQAHVALKSDSAGNTYFDEHSLVSWESLWGLALLTIVGAWSLILARLQWSR